MTELDFVVASIHSGFGQDPDKIMARLESAMRNPYVDVIGHPTGRLIGRRPGYRVDVQRLLEIAAETGTALEINSFPDRLDLGDEYCQQASKLGIKLCIDTDSHSAAQLDYLRYGVGVARRGWLEKRDVLNCLSLQDLLAWRKKRMARAVSHSLIK